MRILSHIHLWVREYEAINTTGVVSPRRRLWPTDTLDRWQLPRHTRRQYETIDLLSHLRMQTLNWFMYLGCALLWFHSIPLVLTDFAYLCQIVKWTESSGTGRPTDLQGVEKLKYPFLQRKHAFMLHTLNSNSYLLLVRNRLLYLQSLMLHSVSQWRPAVSYWLLPGNYLGVTLAVWYTCIEWYESLLSILVYGWLQSVSSQWELFVGRQQTHLHVTNESCFLNGWVSLERNSSWVLQPLSG